MSGFEFMRNLSESGLVPDRHSLRRFTTKALTELAFLYILSLRILLVEDETHAWARTYARRSSLGSSFHPWRSDGSDLYVLMFALSSPEADDDSDTAKAVRDRLGMFSHTVFKWLKDAANRSDMNEHETRRVFTSLDVKFHIENPTLRSLRRLVQDWPHLQSLEQRTTMTRLLQLLRDKAHKGELYVHLNSLAGRLDLKPDGLEEASAKPSFLRDLFNERADRTKTPSLIAAIRHGGKVYRGKTHLAAISAIEDPKERSRAMLDGENRGYVDAVGRFLSRSRALDYAQTHDLISDEYKHWFKPGVYGELPSEALRSVTEMATSGGTAAANVAAVPGAIGAGFDDDYSKSVYPPPKKKPKVLMLRRSPIA